MSHYFATLTLLSQLEVRPAIGQNPPTVILHHKDTPILAQVPRWLTDRLNQAPPEVFKVNLHPKTDREGILAPPADSPPGASPKGAKKPGCSTSSARWSL